MAARKMRGTKERPWTPEHRERIQTSMLINRLQDHVVGKVELTSTQVTAALGLLKKAVPDLSSVEQKTEVTHRNVVALPELAQTVDDWKAKVSVNRH